MKLGEVKTQNQSTFDLGEEGKNLNGNFDFIGVVNVFNKI